MPTGANTSHRLVDDMAIPYVTFDSPIAATPAFEEGLNVMTSVRRVLERRPGFSRQAEPLLSTLPGRIDNIYTWRRWNGSFYIMLSVTGANTSQVWKQQIGADGSFIKLLEITNTTEPFSFLARNNHCFMGCGIAGSMKKYDGTRLSNWGIAHPRLKPTCAVVAPPAGVGHGIDCEVDYHYRYTYWNALTANESSPSEVNDCISQFSDSAIQLGVRASTDPQVTHINIYRTRDGGSTDPRQMQMISQSPVPNQDATITDYTEDADLRNVFAPSLLRNEPPPPLQGFKSHASRIFGYSGNQVWYSGFDEITNGMQEECFPGGESGNFYPFDDEVASLAPIAGENSGMAVFLPGAVHKVDGELRNELRRYQLDSLHGARFNNATASYGADVMWFDTSAQVRASNTGEVSMAVRPDLAQVSPQNVMVVPHVAGTRQWLCILDGNSGKMYVYDRDTDNWQVPWDVGASAIYSGEIAKGQRVLLAAINNQVWYMEEGQYNDCGVPYPAFCKTNLIPLAPEANPDDVQILDSVSIERNSAEVTDIKLLLDDDTHNSTAYKTISIPANKAPARHRKQGAMLIEERYTVSRETFQTARRGSLRLEWPTADKNFELYSINVEVHASES